jgi:hypothetical protein
MRKGILLAGFLGLLMSTQELGAQEPQRGPRDSMMMNMKQHMRMMDSTTAVLDTLVSRMNRATGNTKITAMAQIINSLVSERKAMQAHMRQMMQSHGEMMREHMRTPRDDEKPEINDTSGHGDHHPT